MTLFKKVLNMIKPDKNNVLCKTTPISNKFWGNAECLVVYPDKDTIEMLESKGIKVNKLYLGDTITDELLSRQDFVLFTGGTDISTSIYGEEKGVNTDRPDGERDLFEINIIKRTAYLAIGMVGICRGAQLLNCVFGGKLRQHDSTTKHLTGHSLHFTNETFSHCKANHHQIMLPPKEAEIVAKHGNDAEIVFFDEFSTLCVQYHPEWHDTGDIEQDLFFNLVFKYAI